MTSHFPHSCSSLASGYKFVLLEVDHHWVEEVKSITWYQRKEGLKGHTGRWSKHGSFRNDYQSATEEEWVCQSCGQPQPKELPPFLSADLLSDVSLRVCPICLANGCFPLRQRRS